MCCEDCESYSGSGDLEHDCFTTVLARAAGSCRSFSKVCRIFDQASSSRHDCIDTQAVHEVETRHTKQALILSHSGLPIWSVHDVLPLSISSTSSTTTKNTQEERVQLFLNMMDVELS